MVLVGASTDQARQPAILHIDKHHRLLWQSVAEHCNRCIPAMSIYMPVIIGTA